MLSTLLLEGIVTVGTFATICHMGALTVGTFSDILTVFGGFMALRTLDTSPWFVACIRAMTVSMAVEALYGAWQPFVRSEMLPSNPYAIHEQIFPIIRIINDQLDGTRPSLRVRPTQVHNS